MTARRRPMLPVRFPRLGPLLIAFVTGGALVFLALGLSGRIRWEAVRSAEGPAAVPTTGVERERAAALLAAVLEPQANWRVRDAAVPLHWRGEIPSDQSLVQWNARITRLCEQLGLEIVAGTEEIVERRGRWPLQRLTLVAGLGGETLATLIIEAARPPALPPTF